MNENAETEQRPTLEEKKTDKESAYLNEHMKGITLHVTIPQSFKNDPYLFYLIQKRIDEAFGII